MHAGKAPVGAADTVEGAQAVAPHHLDQLPTVQEVQEVTDPDNPGFDLAAQVHPRPPGKGDDRLDGHPERLLASIRHWPVIAPGRSRNDRFRMPVP
ncbi:MAG TPA: hypothetical protein VHS32_37335 [Streptosporangiaceae bacterium]|nr:hypothetical protein [Streptosporangiaceae bacterium]